MQEHISFATYHILVAMEGGRMNQRMALFVNKLPNMGVRLTGQHDHRNTMDV